MASEAKDNAPQPRQLSVAERLYPHLIKQSPQPPKAASEEAEGVYPSVLAAYGLLPREENER
jgi:hypothetical protein